jgi:hypothetical protein
MSESLKDSVHPEYTKDGVPICSELCSSFTKGKNYIRGRCSIQGYRRPRGGLCLPMIEMQALERGGSA